MAKLIATQVPKADQREVVLFVQPTPDAFRLVQALTEQGEVEFDLKELPTIEAGDEGEGEEEEE